MTKGVGRRAWRELYPADDWNTADSFQVFDLKYVLFTKRGVRTPSPPAAILCFDRSNGIDEWEVVGTGTYFDMKDRFFEMNRTLGLARSPADLPNAEAKALKQHPDFGRF